MSLRGKAATFILIMLDAIIVALYLGASRVLLRGFARVEHEAMLHHVG